MPDLVLYHLQECPFCQKVRDYMKENNIEVPMKDTMSDPAIREELIGIGGKSQVPCLVIDGKPLYESLDIIKWFEENWQKA